MLGTLGKTSSHNNKRDVLLWCYLIIHHVTLNESNISPGRCWAKAGDANKETQEGGQTKKRSVLSRKLGIFGVSFYRLLYFK